MPSSTTLSSLESLLLFQYLYSYGISAQVFAKIAENLKNDPLVRAESGYDATRLNPDTLRDFFLRLIKDESKETTPLAATEPESTNGLSRKRKAPSPSLPSLQEAIKDSHLIPSLITKLYARFREQTVADIRKEETLYDKLQNEISEIQRGEWDAKLKQLEDARKQQASASKVNGEARPGAGLTKPLDKTVRQQVDPKAAPITGKQPLPVANIGGTGTGQRQPNVVLPTARLGQPPSGVASPAAQSPRPLTASTSAISPGIRTPGPTDKTAGASASQSLQSNKPLQPLATPNQGRPVQQQVVPKPLGQQTAPPTRFPTTPYANAATNVSTPPYPRVVPPPPSVSPHPSQRGGGIMLQPFQVSPQPPTQIQQQQQLQTPSTASTVVRRPSPTPRASQPTFTPDSSRPTRIPIATMAQILANPSLSNRNTPVHSPSGAGTPLKMSPSDLVTRLPSPERPRSVSPLSDRGQSPEPTPTTVKPRRSKRGEAIAFDPTPATSRSTRAPSRRLRGASAASSVVASSARGRTRSQSVLSQASVDRHVKAETPAAEASDVPMTDGTPMAAPSLQVVTRRGGALRGKRKRSATVASEAASESASRQPPPQLERPNTVLAVRNFPRLSNPIMNDITSHKHASLFSMPVRERDAEGYGSMIRRPTDLKTIKAAIVAGARAVNSALEDHPEASSASALLLPWSEDLVPPKAIVNSAQLERELMRMFANAVMFNPGEQGVVADTREMFESVGISLAAFREAERGAEVSVVDLAKAESEAGDHEPKEEDTLAIAATSKRRRVG